MLGDLRWLTVTSHCYRREEPATERVGRPSWQRRNYKSTTIEGIEVRDTLFSVLELLLINTPEYEVFCGGVFREDATRRCFLRIF